MEKPKKTKNTESKNKLSILINQGGLSFCVSNPLRKTDKTIFAEKYFGKTLDPVGILEQIELAFEQYNLDFDAIEKAQIIFSNNLYTFVPQPFFDKEHLSDYLKFNTKILGTDFIAYDELGPLKLNNVYIPYANINNYFFEKFGTFEYQHSTSVLVKNLLALEKTTEKETVYIHVYSGYFDMMVIQNNKLLLCNTFSFDTPEDFLYYILFVAEQLKIDPNDFPLVFLGAISEKSEIYQTCFTYIRNCSFLEDEVTLKNEFNLSDIPQKINYVLLKAHACV